MSRNRLTKEEMKCFILKQKHSLYQEDITFSSDPKSLTHKYLNQILEKLDEFSN